MKETLAAMNIHHVTTSFYHPKSAGMVEEWSHRTLISIISKKIATEGNSWDRWFGFSLAAMRFGVNESTKQSPFFLLYNREVGLPIDNILKPIRKYQGEEPHEIAIEQQHKNFLLVHQNRKKAQKKRNELINKTRSSKVELKVGDPVYYRNHKPKSELDIKWQPYYRIIEQTSPVTFIIKHTLDGSTTKVHAEHLRYADLDEWEIPKDQTGKRLRPAQYVVPPLDPSSESKSDVDKTRSNKFVDRQLRDRENSQSEDNIPLAELQNRIRSRQARLKYEDKHIPVEYDTSTESYFSESESDD